tara:strand:+ start:373 stop:534 length:162 start_codon:yes stop_codon:yes gene_type:complete
MEYAGIEINANAIKIEVICIVLFVLNLETDSWKKVVSNIASLFSCIHGVYYSR